MYHGVPALKTFYTPAIDRLHLPWWWFAAASTAATHRLHRTHTSVLILTCCRQHKTSAVFSLCEVNQSLLLLLVIASYGSERDSPCFERSSVGMFPAFASTAWGLGEAMCSLVGAAAQFVNPRIDRTSWLRPPWSRRGRCMQVAARL